eukprot:gene20286-22273_t
MAIALRKRAVKQIMSERLPEEQIIEYNDAFQAFDKDANGFITTKELKSLMRCLGCNPTDSELQQIINEVDADGNGKIDFPEFVQLMEKMTKPKDEEKAALDAFRVFDPEGRGYISSQVLREILQKSLDQVPQSEVFDLLDHSGLQEDKMISFKDFALLVKPKNMFTEFHIDHASNSSDG